MNCTGAAQCAHGGTWIPVCAFHVPVEATGVTRSGRLSTSYRSARKIPSCARTHGRTAGNMGDRVPLADRALSEGFARLRYHDTSLLIWQQQQLELERAPPATYLNRSQSAWYSQYGNEAVLVRDRTRQEARGHTAASRICSLM
ncbi:hypothetical protein AGIG_G19318 [Arapaima gigas]